jgi:hypothetical protein
MMANQRFESPEDAAMTGFPPEHCRVVASRIQQDQAYVLLDTGSESHSYLYGVHCHRESGSWIEDGGSNANGWQQTGHDPDVGTLSFWGEAPARADMVRVEFDDEIVEHAVEHHAYLVVWWGVPEPERWPRVTSFRVDGQWCQGDAGP